MQVKVANKMYQMSKKEYTGLLMMASEQVPFGIYAVEKNGYAELRCDRCNSMTQLKNLRKMFRQNGFKVYENTHSGQQTDSGSTQGGLMSAT